MPHSHLRVYVHFVWATWDRLPLIPVELRARLYAIIREICGKRGCEVLAVGGMPDHLHLLVSIPATVTLADLIHDVKGATSRWLNQQPESGDGFRWQGSYGAFSVSPHERTRVVRYITDQEQHHAEGSVWGSVENL